MKKTFTNYCKCVLLLSTILCLSNLHAQKGYSVDSLQIKVYTEIDYVNNDTKAINIRKVFCEYCTEDQKRGIEDEALRRSYLERNDKKNKLANGRKRLAIYIRISRSDFAYLEGNQEMSLENYLIRNLGKNIENSKTANNNNINTNTTTTRNREARVSSN